MDSRFTKQSCRDIAHVRLFELVVLAAVTVDSYVFECGYHVWDAETHVAESIDEVFVVASVSADTQTY